jgi:hypothetical protein
MCGSRRVCGCTGATLVHAQAPVPAGKVAPRPLYRDPPFDAPTDPVLCDGKLIGGDPAKPTYIDLKAEREAER